MSHPILNRPIPPYTLGRRLTALEITRLRVRGIDVPRATRVISLLASDFTGNLVEQTGPASLRLLGIGVCTRASRTAA